MPVRHCAIFALLLAALVAVWIACSRAADRSALNGGSSVEGTVNAPEFPKDFAWLNTDKPLRFADELKGQVVLLDFWTYCCINCMHVIPDLEYLEQKFKDEPFLVVGVHSAKFDNEGDTANVRSAIQRYNVHHPVIVDQRSRIWQDFAVNSWPTLVLVGSDGKIIGAVSGEGHRDMLEKVIAQALADARAKGTLAKAPLKLQHEGMVRSASGLAFPGKILADPANKRLIIVDSNHNRMVLTTWPDDAGRCAATVIIGSGASGQTDGSFAAAQFNRPQGAALAGDILYVADTENHLIRRVDLVKQTVATILGTGKQEYDREGGKTGRQQGLNSPWDVAVSGNKLYISMAGQHQIYVMNLLTGMAETLAGSGRENIRDGAARDANLAQPSGLALDPATNRLYFADSEVSAIRYVDLGDKTVHTIIGHGLFDFGSTDGDAQTARFQHPLGVALFGKELLVADTYNHNLRLVDPAARTAASFAGVGKPGSGDSAGALGLSEPASIAVTDGKLFVADTNNHRIVLIDSATKAWKEVMIDGLQTSSPADAGPKPLAAGKAPIAAGKDVQLAMTPKLPTGTHLTPGAPISVQITANGQTLLQRTLRDTKTLPITVAIPAASVTPGTWRVRLGYAYCSSGLGAVCTPGDLAWQLEVTTDGSAQEIALHE